MTRARDVSTPTALVLVSSTTIGTAVSAVTVNNAFSSTYDAYKIIISGGAASATNTLQLKFGASATGYAAWGFYQSNYSAGAPGYNNQTNGTYFGDAGGFSANGIWANIDISNPYLAKYTSFFSNFSHDTVTVYANGLHKVATSYTDFTLTVVSATLTGGTISVYGYKK